MKIPEEVKKLPWPDLFEGNPLQHFRMHVNCVNADHERLLVITFCRNLKMKKLYVAPDFRYILSKKQPGVVITYRVTNKKSRIDLRTSMDSWGVYLGHCYPEISEAEERKLSLWLGKPIEKTTNHMIPELEEWIIKAIQAESLRERAARGELMDWDVDLCPEELPEGIERFLRQEVLPRDNVLLYKKGNVRGRCFRCGEKVKAYMQKFTQQSVTRCPSCGKIVTCYLETSENFKVDYVQNIASVQRGTDGKTVFVRLWHLCRDGEAKWENITDYLQEVARWAIRGSKVAKWQKEVKENWYMNCQRYSLDRWHRMDKPSVIYDGSYIFYLPPNQEEIFEDTSLCYCDLGDFLNRAPDRNKNPIRFLMDWPRYAMVEKLWKAGYTELVYEKSMGLNKENLKDIKWNAAGIGQSMALPKRFLKLMPPKEWTMQYIHRATEGWAMVQDGRIREGDMLDYIRSGVSMEDIKEALPYASFHKIMKYLSGLEENARAEYQRKKAEFERQGRAYQGHLPRNNFSGVFRDYLSDCRKLHFDLKKRDILFPKDLEAAHARTTTQVQYNIDKIKEETFRDVCQRNKWMEWEQGDYLIRLPVNGKEVIYEGQYLHHCVGGYVDRMANGKTLILFIREKAQPETPFYTLEWLNDHVQQCHSTRNMSRPEDLVVDQFVRDWEKELPKLKRKKAAAASADDRRKTA